LNFVISELLNFTSISYHIILTLIFLVFCFVFSASLSFSSYKSLKL
jgi:hypothetical protein